MLFSHPKDFTPVCTTELGYMAKIKPEFDRRNVKVIGLSVDPIDKHEDWANDIEETQGAGPTTRSSATPTSTSSKLYGMLPAGVSGDPNDRTAADNQTVRNVFVIGPDKKVKLILVYPMTTGRNFDEVLRVIDSLQLTAKHKVATPANWKQGEDVIIAGSVSNDEASRSSATGRSRSPTSASCPSRTEAGLGYIPIPDLGDEATTVASSPISMAFSQESGSSSVPVLTHGSFGRVPSSIQKNDMTQSQTRRMTHVHTSSQIYTCARKRYEGAATR